MEAEFRKAAQDFTNALRRSDDVEALSILVEYVKKTHASELRKGHSLHDAAYTTAVSFGMVAAQNMTDGSLVDSHHVRLAHTCYYLGASAAGTLERYQANHKPLVA
jgi:hypothetical protein